jgi:ABC-2 type transport system ATP-binding protein
VVSAAVDRSVAGRSIHWPGPRGQHGRMAIIEVTDLGKRYGRQVAVDGVSFAVEEGEIFGILGPRGAGKTTTVECVAGLRAPDRGRIRVDGLDPRRDRAELRHRIGAQLQDSQLPERMTVGEALDLYSSFYRDPADWRRLAEAVGLADDGDTEFGRLSGGLRQRLAVALALVGRPRIVVLDELTTGLDPQARRDTGSLVEGVRNRGVTVLLVTHFLTEAERLCDRLAVVDAGRVIAIDSPAGLVSRADAEQRVRFRPSAPVDERLLVDLPEVTGVRYVDGRVHVTGTGNVLHAVASVLARHRIVADELRVEQNSLDDAFVALIGGILND